MPLTGFQLPSPRAIEPSAGEFALAAKSSNPDAFLYRYMGQRDLAQGDYDRELQAQHAFALQQQQAQIRNELQSRAAEFAKIPGGGRLLAEPGSSMGMSLGASPGALTNLAQAGEDEQSAKNFQANMTGLNQGAQGGYQLAPGSPLPPGMPAGMTFTNLGPAILRSAQENTRGRLGAAEINAGGKGPGYTENVQYPAIPLEGGGELTTGGSFTKLKTPEDREAARGIMVERGNEIVRMRSGSGASGVTPPPRLSESLPPAKKDPNAILGTVPNAPGVSTGPGTGSQAAPAKAPAEQAIDTNSPLGKAAQTSAMKYLDVVQQKAGAGDVSAAAALADIRTSMSGGAFPIVLKADGGVYIKGTKGQDYLLGKPTPGKR